MKIFKQTLSVNNLQYKVLLNKVKGVLQTFKNKKIAILGLSFKENTDDVRYSIALKVVHYLVKAKSKLNLYDPVAIDNFKKKSIPRRMEL